MELPAFWLVKTIQSNFGLSRFSQKFNPFSDSLLVYPILTLASMSNLVQVSELANASNKSNQKLIGFYILIYILLYSSFKNRCQFWQQHLNVSKANFILEYKWHFFMSMESLCTSMPSSGINYLSAFKRVVLKFANFYL